MIFASLPTASLKHLLAYMAIAPSKHLQTEVQYIHAQSNTPQSTAFSATAGGPAFTLESYSWHP